MNGIHVNPNLTSMDKLAFLLFFSMVALMFTFLMLNVLNRYMCENHGRRCFWCKKFWVGRGCGCISRYGKVGPSKGAGSDSWKSLSFQEKTLHMARFNHRKFLESRRSGRRADSWCFWSRREAYLSALRFYKESQGVAVR